MSSSAPWWRDIFDAVERPVGDALARATGSDLFADVAMVTIRVRDRTQREIERRTRHVLHLVNVPAATDVRRLSAQVAALQRQVRRLEAPTERGSGPRPVTPVNGR